MALLQNAVQARTNWSQHSPCSTGKASFRVMVEYSRVHRRHASAVIDEKPEASLDGMHPTSHGTMTEFTIDCSNWQSRSLRSFLSLHVCSVVFAMPKNRLCIGSMMTSLTGLKYSRV